MYKYEYILIEVRYFPASCFGDLTIHTRYLSMSACIDSLHSFDECMPYESIKITH